MKFWECREIRHEFIFYRGKLFERTRNIFCEHTIKFVSCFRRKKLNKPIRIFTIFIVQTLYKHSIPNIFAIFAYLVQYNTASPLGIPSYCRGSATDRRPTLCPLLLYRIWTLVGPGLQGCTASREHIRYLPSDRTYTTPLPQNNVVI